MKNKLDDLAETIYKKYRNFDKAIELSDVRNLVELHKNEISIRCRVIDDLRTFYNIRRKAKYISLDSIQNNSKVFIDNSVVLENTQDLSKYKIGQRCQKRNHHLKDSHLTLRYKTNNACVACQIEKNGIRKYRHTETQFLQTQIENFEI
jgi:hypothetical protein